MKTLEYTHKRWFLNATTWDTRRELVIYNIKITCLYKNVYHDFFYAISIYYALKIEDSTTVFKSVFFALIYCDHIPAIHTWYSWNTWHHKYVKKTVGYTSTKYIASLRGSQNSQSWNIVYSCLVLRLKKLCESGDDNIWNVYYLKSI